MFLNRSVCLSLSHNHSLNVSWFSKEGKSLHRMVIRGKRFYVNMGRGDKAGQPLIVTIRNWFNLLPLPWQASWGSVQVCMWAFQEKVNLHTVSALIRDINWRVSNKLFLYYYKKYPPASCEYRWGKKCANN